MDDDARTRTDDRTSPRAGRGHDPERAGEHGSGQHSEGPMYGRFAAMIATSTTAMFLLTYTNTSVLDHVRFSEERLYMALLMGSAMTIIMLGYMWGMYRSRRANVAIVAGAVLVGATAVLLVRSQALIEDRDYMSSMIPHHSIAILTSERSGIEDVRVRELADQIISSQRQEIAEMEWLLRDIQDNGVVTTEEEAAARPVPDASAAP
jgi:hypothetical protein